MRVAMRLLCALVPLLLLPGLAAAAPLGSGFTYQGELSQSGAPVEGSVHLRFSLWDAAGVGTPPTGGIQIGASQVIRNVPVSGGLFSALVNAGNEFGAQAFNGQARWLQIDVCADSACGTSTTLGPRQPVTAAPYSLGPWQLSGSNLNFIGGRVGIGTASPAHTLHVKDTEPALVLEDNAAASQQAGYISFRNSASETGWIGYGTAGSPDMTLANARPGGDIVIWAGGERLRVDYSSGNVGVGTAVPSSRLEVRGDIRLGPVGEYFAPGGSENLRVIRGKVSAIGNVALGSGFTTARTGVGACTIFFNTSFPTISGTPVVTVTAESLSGFVVAIVAALTNSAVSVRIVNASNTPVDAPFHFVVAGPR